MTSEQEAQLVQELAGIPWVAFAYLFGSQARGDARPDSDVDVAVKLIEGAAPVEPLRDTLSALGAVGNRLHLCVLDGASPLFRHRVLRDGRLLFERDSAARIAFMVCTLREFADREWVERFFQASLRERLVRGEAPGGGQDDLVAKTRRLKDLLCSSAPVSEAL